jgi:hypothetical protein
MNTKNILTTVILLALAGAGVYWGMSQKAPLNREVVTEEIVADDTNGKIKAAVFQGTLEVVNTSCFFDGECYVVVDGKHVTAIMGWSQEIAGTVIGVEGFGDLESHIGEGVEVYAQDKGDGSYSLYGSAGFYIKVL